MINNCAERKSGIILLIHLWSVIIHQYIVHLYRESPLKTDLIHYWALNDLKKLEKIEMIFLKFLKDEGAIMT